MARSRNARQPKERLFQMKHPKLVRLGLIETAVADMASPPIDTIASKIGGRRGNILRGDLWGYSLGFRPRLFRALPRMGALQKRLKNGAPERGSESA